ncbi:D-alanyl-D-alanine carboxypeptidase [Ureibacillus massiliensis 4400831 = CIP 108448 = CCUG 49529]|uniref:serine-type D-Ala-D-Ala carboxypeptidase n=1 Tax=Ureibacillus massiliensis 4400831 = CIP 108448 = CCUG 49529 TaxID=1211035 RepID=A0A0A3J3E9_9BACL|nr:D-alanyl-D-alanine carboxypeptidase family protein [Ureibacillus massiliensis]KGR89698.1 D-alanyl-D-alanine carboxypeptidase [Ureibacillus massiliensis 4400831 = CIP 108448 = CCUG 49529]
MKTVRKTSLFSIILIPILLLSFLVTTPLSASAETDLSLTVDAAILIDAETGKILYEQNADTNLGIASMTKMMTEYILLDAINAGTITWDQQYRVTEYTYRMSQDRALSNVPLRADGTYSIQELYEAMAIYSANAATVAIAETIAGTESEFLNLMNQKAEEIGLTNYKFVNSTGLNNSDLFGMHPAGTGPEDENVMSAHDVAKLAYNLLKDHPEVTETSSISKKIFREGTDDAIEMENWNFMLPGLVYEYEGVDGLKTGTTTLAGYCFTGTAERNGTRLIAVVMNAVDSQGVGSYKARFDATAKLFDYGFAQFSKQEIVPANYTFEGQESIAVTKGKADKVGIAVKDPISVMIKANEKDLYQPKLILETDTMEAEVKEGTVVGKVVIERTEGTDYGYINGDGFTADVVTTETVERASGFSLFFQAIGGFFASIWNGITGFVGGLFS